MDTLKEEFKLTKFGLSHNKKECFTLCQWRWHYNVFPAYRTVLALYVSVFFLYTLISMLNVGIYNTMAFLTMWTYLMFAIYLVSSALVAILYKNRFSNVEVESTNFAKIPSEKQIENGTANNAFVEMSGEKDANGHWVQGPSTDSTSYGTSIQILEQEHTDITNLMKISWVFGNIIQGFIPIVTVVYFTALFPLIGQTNFTDINLHGATTFLLLVDTCVVARPVRLLHIIHPAIYGLCYLIFSAIYWSIDHSNVLYPGVLDWNYPGMTMVWVCGLTFVALPLLQLLFFALYRLRVNIYQRLYGADFEQL
ncbi:hypothetical protein ACF0H5_015157 [Mactra antiquata]